MIYAIFLASGRSRRFGAGNKLLYPVEGIPMAERVFQSLPPEIPGLVVTGWDEVAALAQKHENLRVVENREGAEDVAVTVRKGIEALPRSAEGAVFFVCDQPYLTRRSVERLLEAFRREPEKIHVLSFGDRSGNPCVFPRRFFPELSALPKDKGGKTVVRRHMDYVNYVRALSEKELRDVDVTPG